MIAFKKQFKNGTKNSVITEVPFVIDGGPIARFVFDKSDIAADGVPKRKAFKPELYQARYELSICGLNNVHIDRMWHLGKTIRANQGKSVFASIFLTTDKISGVGLKVEPAPEKPHFEEHGVVLEWPEDRAELLAKQLDLVALCSKDNVGYPP